MVLMMTENSYNQNVNPNRTRGEACKVVVDVPASCSGVAGVQLLDQKLPYQNCIHMTYHIMDLIWVAGQECPLFFFFHGAGGSNTAWAQSVGVAYIHGMSGAVDFIGVYPQGVQNQWNTGSQSGTQIEALKLVSLEVWPIHLVLPGRVQTIWPLCAAL